MRSGKPSARTEAALIGAAVYRAVVADQLDTAILIRVNLRANNLGLGEGIKENAVASIWYSWNKQNCCNCCCSKNTRVNRITQRYG